MKQTNNFQNISIEDIKKELFIQEERLAKRFATKNDLLKFEKRFEQKFATKMELEALRMDVKDKMNETIEVVKKELSNFANKMYTRIDPLLKEIEDTREDRMLVSNKLNDHEERLVKLEQTYNITQ